VSRVKKYVRFVGISHKCSTLKGGGKADAFLGSPISSEASRLAHSKAVSPSSAFPPGKAAWPEYELKVLARMVMTTLSSPLGSAKSRIRTAALRDKGIVGHTVSGDLYDLRRSIALYGTVRFNQTKIYDVKGTYR
jgi:hypothetical protein